MAKPQQKEIIKFLKGFTLIELLIVIAILAILASLIFVALKPLERFQDTRNAKRWSDVQSLLQAIKLDQVDHGGLYLPTIEAAASNTYYQIGALTSECDTTCSNPPVSLQSSCVEVFDLIDRGYIGDIPIDPNYPDASADKTGYYFYRYKEGQIAVGACGEELGSGSSIPTIEVMR